MYDLEELKAIHCLEQYTCVLSDGNHLFTSRERGIRPLLDGISSGVDFHDFMAVDTIVGKAAALLYAYMGISRLHAEVLSENALPILDRYHITTSYHTLTPQIINRTKTDICPMERAVLLINEPDMAKEVLGTML